MNDLPFDLEDKTLQPAWLALERKLQDAPSVEPKRGFSRRWLRKWELAEQHRQARRAFWLVMADGAASLALLIFLLPSLLPAAVQPLTALAAQVNALISSWTIFASLLDAFTHVVRALPLVALLVLAGAALLTVGTAALFFSKMNLVQGEIE